MVDARRAPRAARESLRRHEVNVCLEADAGLWLFGGRVRVGPRRSPLHTPEQVAALAREIERRPGLRLVGMMAYEGQIAGVGDHPAGKPLRGLAIRAMQASVAAGAARAAPRAGRGRRGGRRATAVRQRRRHRQPRVLVGRAVGDRADRRLGPVRAGAVRRLHALSPAAGGVLRAAGGAASRRGAWSPPWAAAIPPRDRRAPIVSPVPGGRAGLKLDPQEGAGETQTPLRGAVATR